MAGKQYVFDKVFKTDANQEKVYATTAKRFVEDVLSGYNGTIFAYGQKFSGKTHTMEGNLEDDNMTGIIPRIVSDIFRHFSADLQTTIEFEIKVSCFEIYEGKIRDLLNGSKTSLPYHVKNNRMPNVEYSERYLSKPDEVFNLIKMTKSSQVKSPLVVFAHRI
jgi:kinesin family protein 5